MSSSPVVVPRSTVPVYLAPGEVPPGVLGVAELPVPQFGEPCVEVWPAVAPVVTGSSGTFAFAHDGELLFASASFDESAPIEVITKRAYDEAIAVARAHGYPNLIRMWNHVGAINGDDRGRERYKLFCEGRHDAFAAAGYQLGADLPAASAVGMRERGLMLYFLAATEMATQAENPRQVAAYRYPPQYGQKSPSFSRATTRRSRSETVIYVSGTSSVVGHASVHDRDVLGQLEETIVNLEAILRSAAGARLRDFVAVKTYIRREQDAELVIPALDAVLPQSCSRIYVEADICRSELLLEIEGVARLTRP